MRTRTKNLLILECFGLAVTAGLVALFYRNGATYASDGLSSGVLKAAAVAGISYLFFSYWPVRAMTGLRLGRLIGIGKKKEGGELTVTLQRDKEKPARYFSWLLLMTTPAALAAPVWLFLNQGASMHAIVAGSAFLLSAVIVLFVPPSDGSLASKRVKADVDRLAAEAKDITAS